MSWETRFKNYHAENPHVYDLFKRFAFEAIKAGHRVLSAQFIFERIRWETNIVTNGERWKVNNNYRPHYARLFMHDHPDAGAEFRFRTY